jgi:hypothetical protein
LEAGVLRHGGRFQSSRRRFPFSLREKVARSAG